MAECRKPIFASPGDFEVHVVVEGNATVHGERTIGADVAETWLQSALVPPQNPHPFTIAAGSPAHIIQIFGSFTDDDQKITVEVRSKGAATALDTCILRRGAETTAIMSVIP